MTRTAIHVASKHRPDDTRIVQREARTLVAAGWLVRYLLPWAGPPPTPPPQGVELLPLPPEPRRGGRLLRYPLRVARLLRDEPPAILHLHELELIPLGLALARRGWQVVYDAHEDYPVQLANNTWDPWWLRRLQPPLARWLEERAARHLAAIVAATPTIAAKFPQARTVLVQNFPALDEFPAAALRPWTERPWRLVYVGGLTRNRGLVPLVEALGRLPAASPWELHLAGRWDPPALREELRSRPGWRRVVEHGWLPHAEVRALLTSARLGAVTLLPRPNFVVAQPVKLFEYLAAGVPPLASDFRPWRERLATWADVPLWVDPKDPEAIAAALEALRHDPTAPERARRARAAFEAAFHWEREGERLVALYAELARR